ncbi:MAG: deoxyribodipyrimidine photo-lyase [Gammaproteobacteria bacterium]|nr:deoxyribodipyrimidine photo-lyase [Gammaproteobacteria bacterium]
MSSIIWFRNDLRVHDNPALHQALSLREKDADYKISAIVFYPKKQWLLHDWSEIKIDFYKRHVQLLAAQLAKLNIQLDVVEVDDFSQQVDYFIKLAEQDAIQHIYANSEPEINEVKRDHDCLNAGLPLTLFEADVIVAKGRVLNKSGEMFKVFTPFKKAWLEYVKSHGFEYLAKPNGYDEPSFTEKSESTSSVWPLVSQVEQEVIPNFLETKLYSYSEQRDIPSIKGTSGLSPYLAIGALSPRYLLVLLLNRDPHLLDDMNSAQFTWVNELIWREFYRHLIYHQPALCKHVCFNEKYRATQWPNQQALFNAWCEGKTGYPIVDAAMRQLLKTGWMHNRLRMIVASFLTKHLLVDWRWGEKFFMNHLIDGDLAANNGGWQWAASTGCDAQPYFRIFNPTLQSKKFDPEGEFIRKYLPELEVIPNKEIHAPHKYMKAKGLNVYWPEIVEHKQARLAALDFYK